MSIAVIDAILRAYHACTSMKLVLLILANHAHDDGTHIWPSVDLIAERVCLDRRNVVRILNALCRDGVLVKVRSGGGRKRPSEYAIRLDKIPNAPFGMVNGKQPKHKTVALASPLDNENNGAGVIENNGAGVMACAETVALAHKNSGASAIRNVIEPSIKTKAVRKNEPSVARTTGRKKTKNDLIDEPSAEHLQLANLWQVDIDYEFRECSEWFANSNRKLDSDGFSRWIKRSGEKKLAKHRDYQTQRPGETYPEWTQRVGAV